jgi:DNA-binding LytR/AlgR family response regulator
MALPLVGPFASILFSLAVAFLVARVWLGSSTIVLLNAAVYVMASTRWPKRAPFSLTSCSWTSPCLQQALERARRRLEERSSRDVSPALLARIEAALDQGRPVRRSRILVRQGTGHRAVPIRDVIRFVADDGPVYACTRAGRSVTDYTLNELETRLTGGFIRVSRSDLVQIDRIDRLVSNGDGSSTITLTDGAKVHVSRRRSADVRQSLQ